MKWLILYPKQNTYGELCPAKQINCPEHIDNDVYKSQYWLYEVVDECTETLPPPKKQPHLPPRVVVTRHVLNRVRLSDSLLFVKN